MMFSFFKFFLDKLSWAVHAKHAHLLRWKRFSEHTGVIEEMYVPFKNRIGYILSDYNDTMQRVNRLNLVRESVLNTHSCLGALPAITTEDICIYMRWLICHFYAQKTFMQSIKMIEWLPFQISIESLSSSVTSTTSITNSSASLGNQRSNTESANLNAQKATSFDDILNNYPSKQQQQNNLASSTSSILNKNFKTLENIYLPSQNALMPRNDVLNSISICKSFDLLETPTNRSHCSENFYTSKHRKIKFLAQGIIIFSKTIQHSKFFK